MEFWNDIATEKSWHVLLKLKKKVKFILIGGWACYLLTRTMKSRDIDIITEFEELKKIRYAFGIKKTHFLRKYESLIEGISVDIYVPYYSRFPVPPEIIKNRTISVEGFLIPEPEILIMLKQSAELKRRDSVKGQKDRVDIINLLLNSSVPVSFKKYIEYTGNAHEYPRRLKEIISSAKKEFEYLGIKNPAEIKKTKKALLEKLSGLREK